MKLNKSDMELKGVLGKLFGRKYTLGELMSIDKGRIDRSNEVTVRLVNVYHELKKENLLDKFKSIFTGKTGLLMYYIIFKFEASGKSGKTYEIFVKLSPDYSMSGWQNNTVEVYCSCPDFKYRSAYLLDKNNSLFVNDRIKISLGEALTTSPKDKTPTTILCKHLYAVLQYVIKNYGNLMKTI